MKKEYGIQELCKAEGYKDYMELAEAYIHDSVAPCICPYCGYTTHLEPDSVRGYCDECGRNSMQSIFVMMGII